MEGHTLGRVLMIDKETGKAQETQGTGTTPIKENGLEKDPPEDTTTEINRGIEETGTTHHQETGPGIKDRADMQTKTGQGRGTVTRNKVGIIQEKEDPESSHQRGDKDNEVGRETQDKEKDLGIREAEAPTQEVTKDGETETSKEKTRRKGLFWTQQN